MLFNSFHYLLRCYSIHFTISLQVGYSAGRDKNPTYHDVCSGSTGHSEVVRVVYDPAKVTYPELLVLFFESHNPTQGNAQGNDHGSQYRSGIYYYDDEQRIAAETTSDDYQVRLYKILSTLFRFNIYSKRFKQFQMQSFFEFLFQKVQTFRNAIIFWNMFWNLKLNKPLFSDMRRFN